MRFESNQDLQREEKSILLFLEHIKKEQPKFEGATPIKLGNHQLDYLLVLTNGERITAEIKGVKGRNVEDNHTPMVSIQKIAEIQDSVNNEGYDESYIIFAYEDGIKYKEWRELKGHFEYSGRTVRTGASNDLEMILRFSSTMFSQAKYD